MSKKLETLIDRVERIKNIEDVKKVLLDIIDELNDDSIEDFDWEEVN